MKTTLNIFRPIIMRSIYFFYGNVIRTNPELQITSNIFRGHITLILNSLVNLIKKPLKQIGKEIGEYVKKHLVAVQSFSFLNGFLNFECTEEYYYLLLKKKSKNYSLIKNSEEDVLMIEYSSPNTNKPLHLGHIRNHLLGFSVSEIYQVDGQNVIKIQIINDRGIHICKSILGWKIFSCGENPKNNSKGDHLVGKYYVYFDRYYKKEVEDLCTKGYEREYAEKQAPILQEVRKLLFFWEKGNIKIHLLWKKMNAWVYEGFKQTYYNLGINFDETQYESKIYLIGKNILNEGLKKGIFFKKNDGSVWIDLTNEGLDEKLLLRSDGTSVYITQDIGNAVERFELYSIKSLIYIVGEEQEYHFKVLFIILKRLGYTWSDKLFHLSYGMVQLPDGKMKSREGIVIDADYLIDEMHKLTQFIKKKNDNFPKSLGSLKYNFLKIDFKKRIFFDKKSSLDITSNTGIYIEYTYARICSLYRKMIYKINWKNSKIKLSIIGIYEKSLLKNMEKYSKILSLAKKYLLSSRIANSCYNLSKNFNYLYKYINIVTTKKRYDIVFRLLLSKECGKILKGSMNILGINMLERI